MGSEPFVFFQRYNNSVAAHMYGRTFCTFEAKDKTVGLKGRLIKESFFVCSFEKKATAAGLSLHEKTKLGTEEAFFLLLLSFPLGDIIVKASPISKVNFLCAQRNIELGFLGGLQASFPPLAPDMQISKVTAATFLLSRRNRPAQGLMKLEGGGAGKEGSKGGKCYFPRWSEYSSSSVPEIGSFLPPLVSFSSVGMERRKRKFLPLPVSSSSSFFSFPHLFLVQCLPSQIRYIGSRWRRERGKNRRWKRKIK